MSNYDIIEAYLRQRNFAQMEIDSFNQFVDKKLAEIVTENREITPKIEEVTVEVDNIEVLKPRIVEADGSPRTMFYPMEARMRNRTYSAPIFLSMRLLRRDVEQDFKKAYIGELPIMVKSNRCWLEGKNAEELIELGEDPMDFGGYFIINGSEKVLITQEILASDRVLVGEQGQDKIVSEVISTRGAFKGRVRITLSPEGMLYVTFPASPKKLRLFVLLKALGMNKPEEMQNAFIDELEVKNTVLINLENLQVKTEKEALDKIGKFVAPGQVEEYRLRRAQEVIDAFLLPHIGQNAKDRIAKAHYLVMMATKAIEKAHRLRGEDDKDHYANKRLELSGKLMEHLFRYAFKYFVKDLKFQIDRTVTRRRKLNISTIVRPGAISERIRFAMSTGNWIGRATGVSKFMDRVNYLSPLTDLRKVKSPLDKNRELYEARDVHGTHWGRLCPIETPDGPQCVSPQTLMTMNDGTVMTIKEFESFWQNQKISSIDWDLNEKTEKEASVVRFLKMKPAKKVLEVTTKETGKKIVATIDHPFYSERLGKTKLENLGVGERVAVMPGLPISFERPTQKTILTEQQIIQAIPDKSDKEHILSELKSKGLLPLVDNEKTHIIARLLGHLFGDGSLTLTMKKYKSNCTLVFSGTEGDLREIAKGIKFLGFDSSKITKWHKVSQINGRIVEGFSTRMDCYSKPLWVLFKALGAPVGDKALKETRAPRWLFGQRKIVIKEFLAAYFGSEMTKPSIDKRNGKIFLQPSFSLNKSKELTKNGIEFIEDIKELLEVFGIKLESTKIVFGAIRKNGVETRKIKAFVSSNLNNLISLYGKIGFAYCFERNSLARLASQYLLEKKSLVEKRAKIQKQVIALAAKGATTKQIVEKFTSKNVKAHDVSNWVKKAKKNLKQNARVSSNDFPKFNDWIREHAISENGLCWETIENVKEIECKEVMDITTLQDYHNFFANGFLTGNCGLVKNLSLLAEVTTEGDEVSVEKLIKDMGVKFK